MGRHTQKIREMAKVLARAPKGVRMIDALEQFAKTCGFETLYTAQMIHPAHMLYDWIFQIANGCHDVLAQSKVWRPLRPAT
jgi:hypothetical protein